MSGPLRVERDGEHVVVLTLALPDVRNAMTPELTSAWSDAVVSLAPPPETTGTAKPAASSAAMCPSMRRRAFSNPASSIQDGQ